MYISIDRNSRGNLIIEQYALNKLIIFSVNNCLNFNSKERVYVSTELYHDVSLYILVTIKLPSGINISSISEKKINKAVEEIVFQTLSMKPKNIAIAYSK